jgi:hypothetical protein
MTGTLYAPAYLKKKANPSTSTPINRTGGCLKGSQRLCLKKEVA